MNKSFFAGLLLGLLLGLMLIYAFVGRYETQRTGPNGTFIVRVNKWTGTLAVRAIGKEMGESFERKKWIEIHEKY